jgi:hypothetical protein
MRESYINALVVFFTFGLLCGFNVNAYASKGEFTHGENLVSNGGFEHDNNEDIIPDDWSAKGVASIKKSFGFGEGFSGVRSAKLDCERFVDTGIGAHAMIAQRGLITVEKGLVYKLSFMAKKRGIKSKCVSVALYDTKGWHDCGLNRMFQLPIEDNEWMEFSFLFEATRSCSTTSRLQFWYRETGILWLDDVELVRLESFNPRPTDIVPSLGERNLVPNSSFECGKSGWGGLSLANLGWHGGLDGLVGEIDQSSVFHGAKSFKIELTPETIPVYYFDHFEILNRKIKTPLIGNIGWFKVEKGREYTLSVYLKSSQPGLNVRLGICSYPLVKNSEVKVVSTKWKRYSVVVKPKSEYCFVMVGPDLSEAKSKQAILWIDAIQFEIGNKATEYKPRAGIEMGVSTEKLGNIFHVEDDVELDLDFYNDKSVAQTVACNIQITDFFDRLVLDYIYSANVDPKSGLKKKLQLDEERAGFFLGRFTFGLEGGKVNQKVRFAVIPRQRSKKAVFGVNHAYGRRPLLGLCKIAGINWFRDWSLKWENVESVKGSFDFSDTDKQIDRILQTNADILGLLALPSNTRSSSAPEHLMVSKHDKRELQRLVTAFASKNKNEYIEYVRETIKHYNGRIKYWQVFNEPLGYSLPSKYGYKPSDYAYWVKATSLTVKQENPDNKILIGFSGLGRSHSLDKFKEIFDDRTLDYCDAITVHCYPKLLPPEKFEESLHKLNNLMNKYGKRKPIWVTECGYYSDDDPAELPQKVGGYRTPLPNERMQAEYAIRFVTIMRGNGVERIFYHVGKSTKLNRDNIEGVFFEYGGAPRRIYAAVAAHAYMLDSDSVFLEELDLGKGIKAYLFQCVDALVLVAWKMEPDTAANIVLCNAGIQPYDIMSKPISNKIIELTTSPIYFSASDIAISEFKAGLKIEK